MIFETQREFDALKCELQGQINQLREDVNAKMATIDSKLAQLEGNLTGVKNDFTNVIIPGINTLNTSITNLQQQLQGAGLTAEQQAALDQAVADSTALKTQADNVAAGFTPAPPQQ